jgi:hypothetical protein
MGSSTASPVAGKKLRRAGGEINGSPVYRRTNSDRLDDRGNYPTAALWRQRERRRPKGVGA